MEILNLHGSQQVTGPHFRNAVDRTNPKTETVNKREPITDSVQFSDAAQNIGSTKASDANSSVGGIRFELVNRIRNEIAAGTYDTPERMDAALEKMLARF